MPCAPGRPGRDAGILTTALGYQLEVGLGELDARRFERLTADGRKALILSDTEAAAGMLREALALWRGSSLAEVADRPFAQIEIARLRGFGCRHLKTDSRPSWR